MRKFILIEDRVERQKNFAFNKLNNYVNENFTNICGGEDFVKIKAKILQNDFDVIAIHRSALSSMERSNLIEFCKKEAKDLIFFSGGISSVLIQNIDKTKLLTINSKDFYGNNLKAFLEDEKRNLLVLAFGEKWELNLMFRLADKLYNYYQKMGDKIDLQEIELEAWEKENFFDDNDANDLLTKQDIMNKITYINEAIKKKL